MPKFSIITPVYNSEEWINQCITSVIHQSFSDFELILIDDGSLDDSKNICKEYAKKDKRIVFIESMHNGVSHSRNIALKFATGNYILFLDSDDWLDRLALEKINSICGQEMFDLLIFDYILVQVSGEIRHSKNIFKEDKIVQRDEFIDAYFRKLVVQNYHPYLCDKVYRLDIIKENNLTFDESISYGEDWLFVVSYCRLVTKAYFFSGKLYYYRRTNFNSLSQRFIPDYFSKVVLWEFTRKKELANEFKFDFSEDTIALFAQRIMLSILYEFKQEKNVINLYKKEKHYCNSKITIEIFAKHSTINNYNKIFKRIVAMSIKKKRALILTIFSILASIFRGFERHGKW